MKTSDSIVKIAEALALAQAEIETVIKDSNNPFYKDAKGKPSTFASLAAVREAIREPLFKHSLSVVQPIIWNTSEGRPFILTRITHKSGEWFESGFPVIRKVTYLKSKDGGYLLDAQGHPQLQQESHQDFVGCVTYLRRAALMSFLNLAADDDDGNSTVTETTHHTVDSRPAVKPPIVAPVVKKPEPAMTANSSQVATMKEFEMITALLEKKKLGKEVLAMELKKHGLMVVQGSSMEQVRDIYKTILGMPDGAEE